ncbi:unnamed protein product [Ceratitis capitata]|uniref:(Mediterranean fruit fly) hypothetical protein n=1 Tax=Ceratitis capitata TaxID=7213 RepID=A0A811UJG3_CERCA|nr:unnamed protein product [Ceratitis capitata]
MAAPQTRYKNAFNWIEIVRVHVTHSLTRGQFDHSLDSWLLADFKALNHCKGELVARELLAATAA